jgi:hypothetical protein
MPPESCMWETGHEARPSEWRESPVKAVFANSSTADVRVRSQMERRAAERKRVHALFDAIQVAIHARDRATVDDLMAELAMATTRAGHEQGALRSSAESRWGQRTAARAQHAE